MELFHLINLVFFSGLTVMLCAWWFEFDLFKGSKESVMKWKFHLIPTIHLAPIENQENHCQQVTQYTQIDEIEWRRFEYMKNQNLL